MSKHHHTHHHHCSRHPRLATLENEDAPAAESEASPGIATKYGKGRRSPFYPLLNTLPGLTSVAEEEEEGFLPITRHTHPNRAKKNTLSAENPGFSSKPAILSPLASKGRRRIATEIRHANDTPPLYRVYAQSLPAEKAVHHCLHTYRVADFPAARRNVFMATHTHQGGPHRW
eukprot:NODE_5947_length_590_cov_19.669546_g5782_i0.p1 GENE.NODE_5947_length_590_cov_19.669546_g5782_i0~~NODE_5947_length_590_cov_19.669546_g5782_i0.p1  ORF type:complete len:173 (+),score=34.31 NODE_5947_length_590_cov_19.669546_g5782_i0:19-537(+)